MILHIHHVEVVGPSLLRLRFNDGVHKVVDALPLLKPEFFRRVELDVDAGTVVWPNGADLAQEALHTLPRVAPTRKRRRS